MLRIKKEINGLSVFSQGNGTKNNSITVYEKSKGAGKREGVMIWWRSGEDSTRNCGM
jgi:hypothetical protein